MTSLRIIQITDLHLGATPDSILAGIKPLDSFLAVLDALDQDGHGDDLLLLSGDYQENPARVPTVCLTGY